ncbi:MAG: hypothetical protein ABI460_05685 [Caldimonas sp.]
MDAVPPQFVTEEMRIVDAEGRLRILLSARSGIPVFALMHSDGRTGVKLALSVDGHPSITLLNPDSTGPAASLEVDGKGAHVKFDGAGGASSYVFLNNAGGSGLVLIDAFGRRRLNATVDSKGITSVEAFAADGKPAPFTPHRPRIE